VVLRNSVIHLSHYIVYFQHLTIGTRIANREACDSCTTEEASMNSLQLNGLAAARDGRKNAEELSRCPENLMAAPVPH
jgi:hypothetical protein